MTATEAARYLTARGWPRSARWVRDHVPGYAHETPGGRRSRAWTTAHLDAFLRGLDGGLAASQPTPKREQVKPPRADTPRASSDWRKAAGSLGRL